MNKKYIVALIALCTCFLSLQSMAKESDVDKQIRVIEKISNKVYKEVSENEIKKGSISGDITLSFDMEEVGRYYVEEDIDVLLHKGCEHFPSGVVECVSKVPRGCKTFALNNNWLITSSKCLEVKDGDKSHFYYGSSLVRFEDVYTRVAKEPNFALQFPNVDSFVMIKDPVFYKVNSNIMLIQISSGLDNQKIKDDFVSVNWEDNPLNYPNVLAFSDPSNIFNLTADKNKKGQFFLSTSRFQIDEPRVVSRTLKEGSLDNGLFELNEFLKLSGTATDPLFYVLNNGTPYLIAYNNANILIGEHNDSGTGAIYWDGTTSDKYYTLNSEDLNFIKATIESKDKKSWNTIKNNLFLDTMTKPYFK